jgi:hypothetical protein
MKMKLNQLKVLQELAKSTHHLVVQVTIIFVFSSMDEVEVPTKQPRTNMSNPALLQLLEKLYFVLLTLRAINRSKPPRC